MPKPTTARGEAIDARPRFDTRPTAEILGDFHRELRTQGFSVGDARDLLRIAASCLLNQGPLVVNGQGEVRP